MSHFMTLGNLEINPKKHLLRLILLSCFARKSFSETIFCTLLVATQALDIFEWSTPHVGFSAHLYNSAVETF